MSKSKAHKKKCSTQTQQQSKETKADNEKREELSEFINAALNYPNVWASPPIDIVPEKWLDSWRVIRIVKVPAYPEHFGFHFVGRNIGDSGGAVSSKIEKFDPVAMTGVTRSGRVYRLVGIPGFDSDAEYVLHHWLGANKADAEDATNEFMEQYGISLENIEKLTSQRGWRT